MSEPIEVPSKEGETTEVMEAPPDEASGSPSAAAASSDAETNTGSSNYDLTRVKTSLCQYFMRGPCKNGDNCTFAHGTNELRASAGPGGKDVTAAASKYKTNLCKQFITAGFCPYGETCLFAHGGHELRPGVVDPATAEKQEQSPNYKKVLCKNFLQFGQCSFGVKCQFAHGRADQRVTGKVSDFCANLSEEEKQERIKKAEKAPEYKTKLCQNFEDRGDCEFKELCLFAHGKDDMRADPSKPGDASSSTSPKGNKAPTEAGTAPTKPLNYKTSLCKNFTKTGNCQFGPECQFAHGMSDMRTIGNPKFKTTLCQHMMSSGMCPKGQACVFAHSVSEQRSSGSYSPAFGVLQVPGQPLKFKTAMCSSVVEMKICSRGKDCHFAHTEAEMRAGQRADPKFKTVLCTNYSKKGQCERGNNCNFAHGEFELQPIQSGGVTLPSYVSVANYKTSMCRHQAANGVCSRGSTCHFAHSQTELRPVGGGISDPSGYPGFQPVATGPAVSTPLVPGKRPLPTSLGKTMMCQNFMAYGVCAMQEMCLYAHSPNELMFNKRQRF